MGLDAVFSELRAIMLPHASRLRCAADSEGRLSLDTQHIQKNGKPLWFGGVEIRKSYVSYHLMPVYLNPELLESASPELRKRMQGKSCFNFKSSDPELFAQLARLTEAGIEDYERQGFVEGGGRAGLHE